MSRFGGTPVEEVKSPGKPGTLVDDEAEDYDFSATEMVSNIPSSAVKMGEDIWNAVSNPAGS